MGKYIVEGNNRLNGEISISGSKNSVLPIIASSILNKKTCTIKNCPKIADTYLSIKILKHLGCKVTFEDNTLIINSSQLSSTYLPSDLVSQMRSSIIFLGSLLGREKECTLGYPGGCELGKRPIDLHIYGLKQLGANIVEDISDIKANTTHLTGATINLSFPSVGATENIMLAAVLAKGTTIINNPAKEPEIIELSNFLNSMGAKVSGSGTNKIEIIGVDELYETEFTITPDRIVAGTYIVGTLITQGEVYFNNINVNIISSYKSELEHIGAIFSYFDNGILVKSKNILKPIKNISTSPHPGFPTDMQSQVVSLLSTVKGKSVVYENIFENRTKHIDELCKMGAFISVSENSKKFTITGVDKLHGCEVYAKDLRGGASLILASLVANGTTTINNSYYIQRGYENIDIDLQKLGANISHIDDIIIDNKSA